MVRKIFVLYALFFLFAGNSYASSEWEKSKSKGMTYIEAEMYDKAIEKLSKAIELSPIADYGTYFFRGQAYIFEKLYDQAISDFTKAIEIDPYDISAYSERGRAYALKGWYAQAFYDLDTAIRMKPDDGLSYRYRADAYYQAKEYKMAWADLKNAKLFGQAVSDELMEDYQNKALGIKSKKSSLFPFF